MKRRQFLQSIAATAGAPLMPAGLLGTSVVSSEHYARAVAYVASDACFAPTNLLSVLGLHGETGHAVMEQLKIDGLIAPMGNTGLMYSKTVYAKQAQIAATALRELSLTNKSGNSSDIIQKAQDKIRDLVSEPDILQADAPEPENATTDAADTPQEIPETTA